MTKNACKNCNDSVFIASLATRGRKLNEDLSVLVDQLTYILFLGIRSRHNRDRFEDNVGGRVLSRSRLLEPLKQ